MSELAESIVLGPDEEASRLWQGAQEAFEKADSDLVSLCESLDLGIRAAEILVMAAGMIGLAYDATSHLMFGEAEVELLSRRDSQWQFSGKWQRLPLRRKQAMDRRGVLQSTLGNQCRDSSLCSRYYRQYYSWSPRATTK